MSDAQTPPLLCGTATVVIGMGLPFVMKAGTLGGLVYWLRVTSTWLTYLATPWDTDFLQMPGKDSRFKHSIIIALKFSS